jgi:RND family efflux transporter MFP subunit
MGALLMPRHRVFALLIVCALAGCGRHADPSAEAASGAKASAAALLLAPEDLRTVGADSDAQGPVITGTIQPERRADLRAEVAAVVLQVLKENGDAAHKGDLLVRLDDTAIRDSLSSAQESERASAQALEQAERQYQRLKTLQAQGMTSVQSMEDAEVRRNSAQSDLAAARARVVSARQQLQRTEVRAPFDGVVSDRKVSAGDTVQVGMELVKVIDPASMRFEGLVSADRLHEVRPGQHVSFRINGYPDTAFTGTVRRVDASANATTRQLSVLVDFDDRRNVPKIAGLYAEGRVDTGASVAPPSVADASVVHGANGRTYVWRVAGHRLAKVPVTLGARDARTGDYPVEHGLATGDRILRNPGDNLADGQAVEFSGDAQSTATAAASSAVMR